MSRNTPDGQQAKYRNLTRLKRIQRTGSNQTPSPNKKQGTNYFHKVHKKRAGLPKSPAL